MSADHESQIELALALELFQVEIAAEAQSNQER